ncbi:UDP-N-acetylmuramoyl-tripeptide--D-alanyl-D-alanine ligase [Salinimicrobium sediminis]|uniref:UDP-N-acetylmuramoyl-tripeptide--D-alanyl-D-alanine ligase n=1 Tax=Salinimicrobium sediminis TaxID=1343891 RepID=A0A285X5V2_9FLAO|nr:UDP-N-acetylmuramoyl-tripeptide--D-alanyl-D-alanine ligase [Salinimicrobium sediminis]SOC80685.1 UDP-N-acetylmuramoyl-tripeptide--D-alanyl-D-alanine ligase [Salinimicrobium sediminis]
MKIEKLHQLFLESSGVSTDTRKIDNNSIFFALKGENFNANDFAAEALKKGASYAVIDQDLPQEDDRLIRVEDSLKTLQELATFHRKHLDIPILALTGSNGKTTTKELIKAVLSKKYTTAATVGNLNNHIGVPLTLLSMDSQTEIGIVEMGANHQKEIEFLCDIALPDFGYITNFGKAHLEGFGSVEGVIKGKKELYDHLKQHQKLLFLNLDDPLQKKEASYSKVFSFGEASEADVKVTYLQKNSFAGLEAEDQIIYGNLTGKYNGTNMAAAYTVGKYFEIDPKEIKAALEAYVPQNNRSQVIMKDNKKLILDAYNANPSSMAAALENFDQMEETPKIAILGDMFELGAMAQAEHETILSILEQSRIDKAFVIGKNFYGTSGTSKRIKKFETFEGFKEWIQPSEFNAGAILIKGSRGMALERVLELL